MEGLIHRGAFFRNFTVLKGKRPHFRLRCVAQNIYALCQWSACSPRTTLKISKIKEITNFSGKTRTLIHSQIRKPHGAGVGRYEDSVARNLAFVNLAKKMLSKVAPDIINCGSSQI